MKKGLLFAAIILGAASANAQFYGKLGVGYNMPAATETITYATTVAEWSVVNASYGKGITPVLGIGYMLNEHVGIELSASYLLGGKIKWNNDGATSTNAFEQKATGINILPALVLMGGSKESKIRPYSRLGLAVSLGPKISETVNRKSTSGQTTTTMDEKWEYKTNPALGFTGALGLSFKMSKKARLWVEATGVMMSASLKSTEMTEAKVNGIDVLATIDPVDKSWNYVDKLSTTSTSNDDLTRKVPLSSMGLAVGVSFSFGK